MAFLTLLVTSFALQSPSLVPDIKRDVLLSDKEAIFLLNAEVVAGPGVTSMQWSPDGTYLLVQRDQISSLHPFLQIAQGKTLEMPKGERQFLIYGAPSKKTNTSLRLPFTSQVVDVKWISGSSKALVVATEASSPGGEPTASVYWISAAGESRRIAQAAPDEELAVEVSPTRPLALLSRRKVVEGKWDTPGSVQFIDAEARPLGRAEMETAATDFIWLPDGGVVAKVPRLAERRVVWDHFALGTGSGSKRKLDAFNPPKSLPAPAKDLSVSGGPIKLPMGSFAPIQAVILASQASKEAVFVSSDASMGQLSPDGTSVAYLHRGIAMVRPLARVPKQIYLDMKAEAEKQEAMSNAKQAALALIMLASDMDDVLPGNGEGWRDQVMPYIRNRGPLDAFTYTFGGGDMSKIDSPAEKEIGYVSGPGGRAVAYADGHVKWIPNP